MNPYMINIKIRYRTYPIIQYIEKRDYNFECVE